MSRPLPQQQQQLVCSSEARAFFIVDSLSPGCLLWAKKALSRLGSTLAVSLKQPCPVGVAVLQRSKPGQAAAQLQILLRLGATFQAREFLSCINKLPAAGAGDTADGNMLGSALVALMQHMQKLPARSDCRNNLFVLSSSLAACVGNPKMQRVLQIAAQHPSYFIHFLQLTGPEAELQAAAPAAGGLMNQQQQQLGLSTDDSSDGAFLQMLRSMPACDNITYDSFVADCEAVTDLMCQSWLRELLTPAPGTAARPDLLLRFGAQTLPCTIQQHILQLDPWLLSAHLCPCHHIPMQPSCASSSSSAAAAHAAATDAGSMAALLLLPEATPWSCSISGLPVMSPASSCPSDARILQLGRHTQLTLPCTAEAAAAWPAASKPAGSDASRRLRALQALPLAPGVPFEIEARLVTPPAAVDSMLLYGMPLLLTPAASTGGSSSAGCLGSEAAQDTDAAGFGPRDQQGQAVGVSASEAGMLMHALCQMLLEEQQVLLASSRHDLLRRIQLPLVQWYMLQPAADGSGLLLRWLASREQLLPPKVRDSNALRSSVGGAAADSLAEEVVLLDAEQLESVRASLASLQGCGGSSGSSGGGCSGSSAMAGPQGPAAAARDSSAGGQPADAEGGGDLHMLEADGEDQHDHHQQQQQQPLLLSCGLDEWVSAVLEASSGTYTPPVCAAVLGPPAGTGAVQGAKHSGPGPLAAAHSEPGAAPPPAMLQHQQHQAPGNTGQHAAGQHGMPAGGAVQGPPAASGGGSAPAQQHNNNHNQGQQAGAVQGGAAGGGGGAGGRGGGRGGRRTSASAANGRKLRLSKV